MTNDRANLALAAEWQLFWHCFLQVYAITAIAKSLAKIAQRKKKEEKELRGKEAEEREKARNEEERSVWQWLGSRNCPGGLKEEKFDRRSVSFNQVLRRPITLYGLDQLAYFHSLWTKSP